MCNIQYWCNFQRVMMVCFSCAQNGRLVIRWRLNKLIGESLAELLYKCSILYCMRKCLQNFLDDACDARICVNVQRLSSCHCRWSVIYYKTHIAGPCEPSHYTFGFWFESVLSGLLTILCKSITDTDSDTFLQK